MTTPVALTDSAPPKFPTMNPPTASFAGTLAQHATAWHRADWTEPQIVDDITRVAVTLIPAAHGAAIMTLTMTEPQTVTILAAQGILPDLTLPSQAAAGRADSMTDLPSPHRWPIFTAAPDPVRTGGTIATSLASGRTTFGTLIIATQDYLDGAAAATVTMLTVLAMHASNALAATRDRANLHIALTSRDVIGQAKGILMERRRITADAAFVELTRLSQITNSKLRDVCEALVGTGEIPEPSGKSARPPRP